ncbi:MAG: hypothetical protein C5B60_00125, partial [Chloroflexi bacterium]
MPVKLENISVIVPNGATGRIDLPGNLNLTGAHNYLINGAPISTGGGAGTPAEGPDTAVQFNVNGAFGGSNKLTWTDSANSLSILAPTGSAILGITSQTGQAYIQLNQGADQFGFGVWNAGILQIYSPNRVAIGTGSSATFTEVLSVVGGSVGINTTNPNTTYRLHVNGHINVAGGSYFIDGIDIRTMYSPAGTTGQVQYNSGGLFTASSNFIFDGFRLGVGNGLSILSSPLEVAVSGISRLGFRNVNGFPGIQGYTDQMAGWLAVNISPTADVYLCAHPTGTGRVGVGTYTPVFRFDVDGDVNCTQGYYINGNQLPFPPGSLVPDGQVLTADSAAPSGMSWAAASGGGGGTPAGSSGQVQFNSAGVFGASPNLFWNASGLRLGINQPAPDATLEVMPADNSAPLIHAWNANNAG